MRKPKKRDLVAALRGLLESVELAEKAEHRFIIAGDIKLAAWRLLTRWDNAEQARRSAPAVRKAGVACS